jgi:hypothetical protein
MGRMMRNFIESDKVKELFKQVPPGTVEAIGQSNTPLGNLLKGSGSSISSTTNTNICSFSSITTTLPPLQFDNPERAERIESSLGRAAFGPERIREILMQLKEANFLANGGRVGYIGGGLATTQDYATALSKVGAGTQQQKNRQVQDYARSEASSQIANALQGGQSSLDSYLTNVFGQGTPATTSGKYASYNSPFTGIFSSTRNQMIDDVAQQLVQKQALSRWWISYFVFNEKIMDIKYNPIIGSFVNTANDEPVTQAELLQWAAENPEPLDTPKKSNPKMMNELIDSLTVKQTPDTTTVEEGVETIQKTI